MRVRPLRAAGRPKSRAAYGMDRAQADQGPSSGLFTPHRTPYAMPILTFPLALALSICFVVGSLVTWALQDRRRRQERDELESQMARALQTRYEVYEGLEQTVIKLVTKFDAMETEFKQRLAQSANPRAALDRTVRLRSSNPELWDIEREHHRVSSEQLSEISRRSARITELMEQIQTLEPSQSRLETELGHLKQRYDNAVANAAEFEQASAIKIERLQARIGELEPLSSLLEAAQRDLQKAQSAQHEAMASATQRENELRSQIEQLTPLTERVQQLEEVVARRDSEVGEQKLRILELEGEFNGVQQSLEKTRGRCAELESEAKAAKQALQSVETEFASTRALHEGAAKQLEAAKAELKQSNQRCEVYTTDLTRARASLDEVRAEAISLQESVVANAARVAQIEGELTAARDQAKSVEARAASELELARKQLADAQAQSQQALADLRSAHESELLRARDDAEGILATANDSIEQLRTQLQSAEAKSTSLDQAIGELRAAHADEQAKANEQIQSLNRNLEQARLELTMHRAKLAAHSNHVVEAWSVLSELKPMLETLEQKLKETDEPAAALPKDAPAPTVSIETPTDANGR